MLNKNLLHPNKGVFRAVFLYVGQGESTLLIVPNGENHDYILVDLNIDEQNGGEDIKDFLNEIPKNSLIFINTHPHNDHTKGLNEIKDIIKEVWHSGHKPSKKHESGYKDLETVIKKIGEKNVYYLRGSNDLNTLHTDKSETSKIVKKVGDIDFQIFSPSKYICEEIDGESPEERKKRIHEQCGVIKFTYENKSILLTGDSNKSAWKDFIFNYHKDSLESTILSASHHGSRTFFKDDEDDDIYDAHIDVIKPEYLIVSAPKQKDSPHDHPHDDALKIYKKHIEEKNIYHLGKNEKSVIFDIDNSGNLDIDNNDNKLSPEDNLSDVIYETKSHSKPYCAYVD